MSNVDTVNSISAESISSNQYGGDNYRPLNALQIGLGTRGVVGGGAERVYAELISKLPGYGI